MKIVKRFKVLPLILIGIFFFSSVAPAFATDPMDVWKLVYSGNSKENILINDVAYGNNMYVGVGSPGMLCYSSNGQNWNTREYSLAKNLNTVCYGNNRFVAVGTYQSAVSSDGIVWTFHDLYDKDKKDVTRKNYIVNNENKLMDVEPIILEGRTLLPIRYVAEPLGADVDWDPIDRKATVSLGEKTIELWLDQNLARVNGVSQLIDKANPNVVPISVPPGRTMLPIRFIVESLGFGVDWDPITSEVMITK